MICNRADSFARRSAFAVSGTTTVAVEAFWLTQSVTTTVVHLHGMRPNSKRKNNRFPVF